MQMYEFISAGIIALFIKTKHILELHLWSKYHFTADVVK